MREYEYIDFGSIQVPIIDGLEFSASLDDAKRIISITAKLGDSSLEIMAFAAALGHPLWPEVRAEIRAALFEEGIAAQELDGPDGTVLLTRRRGPNGVSTFRFTAADGPGWMLRGVYEGPAADDPANAAELRECFRHVVVQHDDPSKPERSLLPLQIPSGVTE